MQRTNYKIKLALHMVRPLHEANTALFTRNFPLQYSLERSAIQSSTQARASMFTKLNSSKAPHLVTSAGSLKTITLSSLHSTNPGTFPHSILRQWRRLTSLPLSPPPGSFPSAGSALSHAAHVSLPSRPRSGRSSCRRLARP